MSARAPFAVFDLDGTIVRRDTSLAFLAFVSGRRRVATGILHATVMGLPDLVVSLAADRGGGGTYCHRAWGRWEGRLHERVVTRALRDASEDVLRARGERFAQEVLRSNVTDRARAVIAEHHARGHRTLLASASLGVYVEAVAAGLGMHGAVGTRLAFSDGRATGRFEGAPCWGAEKLRRVLDIVDAAGGTIDHAYGNGRGDRELVAAARVGRLGLLSDA